MSYKIILASDIHLEKFDTNFQSSKFADLINIKIAHIKNEGFQPLVLFPGDISNGTSSYDFLKKINSKVIMIAGNHEFWGYDYDLTVKALQNSLPSNVTFLHNDFAIFEDLIIIGCTLWTDSGYNFNRDISKEAADRMNDMRNITFENWFSPKNTMKLKEFYDGSKFDISEKIANKKWNLLSEIDENIKSWEYISDISEVLRIISISNMFSEIVFEDNISQNDPYLNNSKSKIDYQNPSINWTQFLTNVIDLSRTYSLPFADQPRHIIRSRERDLIFTKLKNFDLVNSKKIVMMTHHLPFYEEFLVGRNEKDSNFALNNSINKGTFAVRNGISYPQDFSENNKGQSSSYFNKSLRGETHRFNDISHIVNYANNGSIHVPEFIINNTSLWVHGHEHYFRYQDFVKGIFFCTNPCGNNLKSFIKQDYDFDELSTQQINEIISKILMEVPNLSSIDSMKSAVICNLIRAVNFKNIQEILLDLQTVSLQIATLAVNAHLSATNNANSPSTPKDKTLLKFLIISYNSICDKLFENIMSFESAKLVRLDPSFTVQDYSLNAFNVSEETSIQIIGFTLPKKIKDNYTYMNTFENAFESISISKIAKKYIENLLCNLNSDQKIITIINNQISNRNNNKNKIISKLEEHKAKNKI